MNFYFLFIFIFIEEFNAQIIISRLVGSKPLQITLQLPPNTNENIKFIASFPIEKCLTKELMDNRLFLDFYGCRISLDWSETLFGTTHYYRHIRRYRRRWRIGPVQKLKIGSAIAHYNNNMYINIDSKGLTTSSIAPKW
ncbi:hypothetical protein Mgra_00001091 [Meloidogyne graminicola]|uniref:ZP domain-containing protein n=1 Tax=Meloidogyne graminicola TaxID=189291 RepID=A0A8T0A299_9BILA|nr:hypothetical protein Mgra_00001091 [Meloidogyne graminicola]